MRAEAAAPSVLLFDFGGTLDSDGVPWRERFFRLFAEEGLLVAPDVFDAAFYEADDGLAGEIPREFCLEQTVDGLSRGVEANLRAKGASRGAGSSNLAPRVAARFLAEAKHHLSKNLPVLSDLSARYKLGIVSNFYGNLEAVCEGAGLAPHLSVTVDSQVLGFQKPDKRIFLAALSKLDASPSDAVFVGDSLRRDMEGARDLGMPHVWLSSGEGEACCPGDRVIHRLPEISEMFL
jgi:HAD superfamily hydrolase (TIGR01509 family)